MTDLPAEAEILRDNLAEEIEARLQNVIRTPEALKAAIKAVMSDAVSAAYSNTFRDCVKVRVDKERSYVSISIPGSLWPAQE